MHVVARALLLACMVYIPNIAARFEKQHGLQLIHRHYPGRGMREWMDGGSDAKVSGLNIAECKRNWYQSCSTTRIQSML